MQQHPLHATFVKDGLINVSALARLIKPELERQAGEILSLEAITLALNRHGKRSGATANINYERFIGEVSVQSGLSALTIPQVNLDINTFFDALKVLHANHEYTLYTRGAWHTALIGKQPTIELLATKFPHSIVVHNLVGLTIKLKPGHLPTPGVCAYILQKFALRGINVTEISSSHDEFTIIVAEQFAQAALACLI